MLILWAAFVAGCSPAVERLGVGDLEREIVTDATLENLFRENREDFVRLARMSDEDPTVVRIAYDFTNVSGKGSSSDTGVVGFSEQRWEEYRSLFRKLRLERGITRFEDGSVMFIAFARGLSVSGITKGYLFNRDGENCPANSLDELEKLPPAQGKPFNCRKIGENWYLYVWQ